MLTTLQFTSSLNWKVPLDWSNLNTIEVVGAGAGGGSYYRWSGGSRLTYGYGGAGGGYGKIENLSLLTPGENVFITVGLGGSGAPDAGSGGGGPGNPGGTTLFGSYLAGGGGTTTSSFPYTQGSDARILAPAGSYINPLVLSGSPGRLYSGGAQGAGGQSGALAGLSSYGDGGGSQNYYSGNYQTSGAISSSAGRSGVVKITYVPSGTHQACVWIS